MRRSTVLSLPPQLVFPAWSTKNDQQVCELTKASAVYSFCDYENELHYYLMSMAQDFSLIHTENT